MAIVHKCLVCYIAAARRQKFVQLLEQGQILPAFRSEAAKRSTIHVRTNVEEIDETDPLTPLHCFQKATQTVNAHLNTHSFKRKTRMYARIEPPEAGSTYVSQSELDF